MSRTTHMVASQTYSGTMDAPRMSITLPAVPGCQPDATHRDTAPPAGIITPRLRTLHGAARRAAHATVIAARIAAIREALEDDE